MANGALKQQDPEAKRTADSARSDSVMHAVSRGEITSTRVERGHDWTTIDFGVTNDVMKITFGSWLLASSYNSLLEKRTPWKEIFQETGKMGKEFGFIDGWKEFWGGVGKRGMETQIARSAQGLTGRTFQIGGKLFISYAFVDLAFGENKLNLLSDPADAKKRMAAEAAVGIASYVVADKVGYALLINKKKLAEGGFTEREIKRLEIEMERTAAIIEPTVNSMNASVARVLLDANVPLAMGGEEALVVAMKAVSKGGEGAQTALQELETELRASGIYDEAKLSKTMSEMKAALAPEAEEAALSAEMRELRAGFMQGGKGATPEMLRLVRDEIKGALNVVEQDGVLMLEQKAFENCFKETTRAMSNPEMAALLKNFSKSKIVWRIVRTVLKIGSLGMIGQSQNVAMESYIRSILEGPLQIAKGGRISDDKAIRKGAKNAVGELGSEFVEELDKNVKKAPKLGKTKFTEHPIKWTLETKPVQWVTEGTKSGAKGMWKGTKAMRPLVIIGGIVGATAVGYAMGQKSEFEQDAFLEKKKQYEEKVTNDAKKVEDLWEGMPQQGDSTSAAPESAQNKQDTKDEARRKRQAEDAERLRKLREKNQVGKGGK